MSTRLERHSAHILLICLVAFRIVGCLDVPKETKPATSECTACHGDRSRGGNELRRAAPPFDLDGNTSSSAPGVGAHEKHLTKAGHAAVACDECHVVPDSVFAKGHVDSDFPAEIVFGSLAKSGGSSPEYDAKSHRCGNTYCHGDATPSWTATSSTTTTCNRCHGFPPALPHPPRSDCSACHGEVIDAKSKFVDASLHVNGKVEVRFGAGCSSCHGQGELRSPPPDTKGNVSTDAFGVGAHSAHVQSNGTHRGLGCDACHTVPTAVDAPGHIDGDGRAEIAFGDLARRDGATPTYDRVSGACGSTYCHGTSSPIWIAPKTSTEACGSCHGLPPAFPHPSDRNCSRCHGAVLGADGKFIGPELHVDGTVQLAALPVCSQCHGSGETGAVPPDLSGSVDPKSRGVGAHERHLVPSATHGAVACSACHQTPERVDSPGHLDADGRAELVFSGLATTNGHRPVYDSDTSTCADTYCHGTSAASWTSPRPAAQICGSCHGLPPALPHPPRSDCENCHGDVAGKNLTFVAAERHVDGHLDLAPAGCSLCHGSSANAAPPGDLTGSFDRSRISVGAHQAHLSGGQFGRSVPCQECHTVPRTVDEPGHLDDFGLAEVHFTGPAAARGRVPTWNHDAASCGSTYCHDPTDLSVVVPTWTAPDGSIECASCHGLPPPAPHPQLSQCSFCHRTVDLEKRIIDRSKHVNGVVDF
ncbi:MAG: CxxxxCH/CxxCH domain-containing protein [Polyangiaceae bacterium]